MLSLICVILEYIWTVFSISIYFPFTAIYSAYEVDLQFIPDESTRNTPKRGPACRKG